MDYSMFYRGERMEHSRAQSPETGTIDEAQLTMCWLTTTCSVLSDAHYVRYEGHLQNTSFCYIRVVIRLLQ